MGHKSFGEFYSENKGPMKLRTSTGSGRKRQNLKPEYDRVDPNYPQILTRLKSMDRGTFPIPRLTAQRILKIYKIADFDVSQSKNLGNTGITLYTKDGKYYLSK